MCFVEVEVRECETGSSSSQGQGAACCTAGRQAGEGMGVVVYGLIYCCVPLYKWRGLLKVYCVIVGKTIIVLVVFPDF